MKFAKDIIISFLKFSFLSKIPKFLWGQLFYFLILVFCFHAAVSLNLPEGPWLSIPSKGKGLVADVGFSVVV